MLERTVIAKEKQLQDVNDERLCIPRLEEKLNRSARETIREQEAEMRRREMSWRKCVLLAFGANICMSYHNVYDFGWQS